jgi:dienelactone hydrolase
MTDPPRHEITLKPLVYTIAGAEQLPVRRDIVYWSGDGRDLTLDLYSPQDHAGAAPAVLFVNGFPDPGTARFLGCRQKEMESYVSWARLVAATGLAAVTYENCEPATDAEAVLRYLRENAAALGIDPHQIGIWACSGHGPLGLSLWFDGGRLALKCAVFCYAFLLDLDGATAVVDASRQYRFAHPAADRAITDLPRDIPVLIVRAGRDGFAHLNETLDRFVSRALALEVPVTLVNHPQAPHAFDLADDSEASRAVIRQVLAFLRIHLGELGSPLALR